MPGDAGGLHAQPGGGADLGDGDRGADRRAADRDGVADAGDQAPQDRGPGRRATVTDRVAWPRAVAVTVLPRAR